MNLKPGQLFVYDTETDDAAIEWLVVRVEKVDEEAIIMVVPVDDCTTFVGTPDVQFPQEVVQCPMVARCGASAIIPPTTISPNLVVGEVPDQMVSLVRQKLAWLARGMETPDPLPPTIDSTEDPEYEEWMDVVKGATLRLYLKTN